MKNTFFSCIITTLGLCLVGTEMKAQSPVQSASGIGEAGSRTAAQPAALGELPAKKKSLTDLGSEVLLLQRTEHFYTHLSVAAAYNSNAFYDYTQKGDWSLETAFDLGARTVLGGSFYLDAAFTMARSDYDTYESLSRNVLGGKATVGGMLFGTVPLGLGWAGQWYFDKDFSSSDLNFQTLSISVPVYSTKLAGGVGLHVIPYFNWVKSNPSNFDQIVPGLAVSLSARLADKTSLGVTVLQSYAHYQHYLPSVFTENRNDWNTTAIVNLTHKITKNLEVRLEARYTNNTSNLKALEFTSGKTVKLYSYDAWLFTPTVAVNYSF